MPTRPTVYELLSECSRSMDGTFSRQEIVSWFRRHYPEVSESTLGPMLPLATSNSTTRARGGSTYAQRAPLFTRRDRGIYRRFEGEWEAAVDSMGASDTLAPSEDVALDPRSEWSWEGNVQAAVVAYLVSIGAAITRVADTASRQRGTDIEASLDGVGLHVEVKGWPSTGYADPRRAGQAKPTSPGLQAGHWFSDGVVHTMRLRAAKPTDCVAFALPDTPRYRRLVEDVRTPLEQLRITVLWVSADGQVEGDVHPLGPG